MQKRKIQQGVADILSSAPGLKRLRKDYAFPGDHRPPESRDHEASKDATETKPADALGGLLSRLRSTSVNPRLRGSRFRELNEALYTKTGGEVQERYVGTILVHFSLMRCLRNNRTYKHTRTQSTQVHEKSRAILGIPRGFPGAGIPMAHITSRCHHRIHSYVKID